MATKAKHAAWQVPGLVRRLDELLQAKDGEVTDELAGLMEEVQETIDAKASAVAYVAKEQLARAESMRSLARDYQAAAQAAERNAERLKEILGAMLYFSDADRLKAGPYTISRSRNSTPTVTVEDATTLPAELTKTKVEPDRAAIIERWRTEQPLPDGVTVEVGSHIRIGV